MRRLVWFGVGVGATVFVVVRGKRFLARFAPEALVEQAEEQVTALSARADRFVREFGAEFTRARAEREEQLMDALLADGQPDPAVVRANRSAAHRGDDHPDRDEIEDLLGYSF